MPRRSLPEVNAGSMADIAFLLLIFFIVATTMVKESGILVKLPQNIPPEEKPPEIRERNIFVVLVNRNNQIMVEKKPTSIFELKDKTVEFLLNEYREDHLPEFELQEVPYFGEVEVTKGVISLQNDRGTKYETYLQVQDQLRAAAKEVRDKFSQEQFGMTYDDLPKGKQEAVEKRIPVKISEAEPVYTN